MKWLFSLAFLLPLGALPSCSSPATSAATATDAGDAPPATLMQENCRKAQTIVQGKVLAVRDGTGGSYSSALLAVEQAYKGPFQPADTVRYYSFREEKYEPTIIGKHLLVFLTASPADGGPARWHTATDLAVFPDNPATESLLHQTLN